MTTSNYRYNDYDVELSPEEQIEMLHRLRRLEIKLTQVLLLLGGTPLKDQRPVVPGTTCQGG